jgi:hypothetical protein
MDFLRDPIWQFLGVLVAVLLAVIAPFLKWLRKRRNDQNSDSSKSTTHDTPVDNDFTIKTMKPINNTSKLHNLRRTLDVYYDDPAIDALCLEYFPQVYDRFSQGMRKDSKITLLLDYCRRSKSRYNKLVSLLESQNNG